MLTIIVIYFSILILGCFVGANSSSKPYEHNYLVIFCMTLIPALLFMPLFFVINGLCFLCVTVICHVRSSLPLTYLVSATLVSLSVIVGYIAFEWSHWGIVGRSRAQFPVESMENRLAYEGKRSRDSDEQPMKFGENWLEMAEALLEQGRNRFHERRERTLAHLHENTVEFFVNSPGFGVGRGMPSVIPVGLPEIPSLPLSQDNEGYPQRPEILPPQSDYTLRFDHLRLVEGFVNLNGFGYIKNRDHVVGFQPHHFKQKPEPWHYEDASWGIRSLELVSLLKHERPRVYLSRKLPRMDELVDAPTRGLDEFEQQGIDLLRKGEDMALGASRNHIRVIGSIRATNQCLKCHQVERGDLLGAFSYLLERE